LQANLTAMVAMSEPSNIRWRTSQKYREFRQRLWEVAHFDQEMPLEDNSEDEDLVVASARQTTTCPLTQTTFDRPVVNPDCGHTYSREAIITMARSATSVRCPIHGCNNTVHISRLHPNEAMERRIARKDQPRIFS
jgi:SUMO ligase MMS21 Smc5/6 complex component